MQPWQTADAEPGAALSLAERRRDGRDCYDEAVAAIRRAMVADCRGAVPPAPAEIARALAGLRGRHAH